MPNTNQTNPDQTPPAINPGQISGEAFSTPPPQPSLPPMIAGEPKKKSKGGRVIATILGFMLLVGGIVGGVVLTQQQQDIREKAVGPKYEGPVPNETFTENNLPSGYNMEGCVVEVQENGSWVAKGRLAGCGGGGGDCEYECPAGTSPDFSDTAGSSYVCGGTYCGNRIRNTNNCCKYFPHTEDCWHSTLQIAPCKAPTPVSTASCQNVRAYSATWTLLTSAQLSAVADGTVVNFCVNGASTGAGTFDKAQFKIKDALQTETTARRPDSTDFCQSYTVLPTDTTIDVKAKIHHTTLDWRGESI